MAVVAAAIETRCFFVQGDFVIANGGEYNSIVLWI